MSIEISCCYKEDLLSKYVKVLIYFNEYIFNQKKSSGRNNMVQSCISVSTAFELCVYRDIVSGVLFFYHFPLILLLLHHFQHKETNYFWQ